MTRQLVLSLLVSGCGQGTSDTDAENSIGSTGATSGATGNTPTTTDIGSTSSGATGGATSNTPTTTDIGSTTTTGAATDGASSGGMTSAASSSTGDGQSDFLEDCQTFCGRLDACMIDAGDEVCVTECVEGYGEFVDAVGVSMGECTVALHAYLMCASGLSCMELSDMFTTQEPGPSCSVQTAAIAAACALDA